MPESDHLYECRTLKGLLQPFIEQIPAFAGWLALISVKTRQNGRYRKPNASSFRCANDQVPMVP